jgi:hypothetical protein
MEPGDREGDGEGDIPAGWYPDPTPSRRPRERLWDGEEWTQWTRDARADRVDDPPAGWHPDPSHEGWERLWTGSKWTDLQRAATNVEPEVDVASEEVELPSPLRPEFGSDGWYPDETQPGLQRYWDGEGWTEYERAAPEAPGSGPTSLPAPDIGPATGREGEPEVQDTRARAETPDIRRDSSADPVAQIAELARLHDVGALTDREFEEAKARVLRRM